MKRTVRRMFCYIMPYKLLLTGILSAAFFSVPLGLLSPVLIGRAIDNIAGAGDVNFKKIAGILLLLAITGAASLFLQWVMLTFTRKLSAKAAQKLRTDAFSNICGVPLKTIDGHSHGDIVSRLVNDADAVSEGLLQALSQLVPGVMTILSTLVVMLFLNVPIALIVALLTPLSILFARFIAQRTSALFREQSAAAGAMSGYVNEMVPEKPLLSALGYEKKAESEFFELSDRYYSANMKATFYSSVSNPGTRFINALVYAAVGVVGSVFVILGQLSVGGLSAFLAYCNQYTRPFNEVTGVLSQMQSAVASAERLFSLIDLEREAPDDKDAVEVLSSDGAVTLRDVFFSYRADKPLIESFSLETKPGMRIALVGATGCGKTTLINLLLRFYETDAGEILIDGTNTTKIKRNSLRALYGMVLQDTFLKKASVRDNIAYGREDAVEEEIIEAAKAAHAHSFIMRLPSGYDTVIESDEAELSAGQKQLLCIARIMLIKPGMLILDEATSSIDTRTEILVQKALQALMEGHTSFIVAHRLSTIKTADCILVMEQGKIVERGTHETLLAAGGAYKKLYDSQFAAG